MDAGEILKRRFSRKTSIILRSSFSLESSLWRLRSLSRFGGSQFTDPCIGFGGCFWVSSRVGKNMENIQDLVYEGWTSKTSSKEKGKGP